MKYFYDTKTELFQFLERTSCKPIVRCIFFEGDVMFDRVAMASRRPIAVFLILSSVLLCMPAHGFLSFLKPGKKSKSVSSKFDPQFCRVINSAVGGDEAVVGTFFELLDKATESERSEIIRNTIKSAAIALITGNFEPIKIMVVNFIAKKADKTRAAMREGKRK